MKKAISFSLFGNHAIYNVGLTENIRLANELYPDYDIHIYYDDSIDLQLLDLASNKVFFHPVSYPSIPGYFWRFFLIDDKTYDVVLPRDLDSRLSLREKIAVDCWVSSSKALHIMRDHQEHDFPIMAGMWGIKSKMVSFNIIDSIRDFSEIFVDINKKISDQIYLQQIILPLFQQDALAHDNWLRSNFSVRFPTDRIESQFVGEIYTSLNQPKYVYSEVFL